MFKACYRLLFIISVFISLNSLLIAETWPIDKQYLLSSSFGEFRNGRLHAGIDIKTNHCTGLPVRAFKKGRIFRLACNFRGYGKVLYIIHEDKSFSVYAHLKNFENKVLKLGNILKAEQIKKKKYFGIDLNLYKKAILVNEGDIIAYSGESGVGFPHLHFELRQNIFTPVNPLSCKAIFFKVKDSKAPVIRGVTISPIDPAARVNGQFFPTHYKVKKLPKNTYKIEKTIYLNSNDLTQYLFSIDLHDKANKSKSKLGIYSILITLNKKNIYSAKIDSIDYRANKKGWLYFNQYLSSTFAGRYFFNLLPDYRQLENLPSFKKRFPSAPIKLKTGKNNLRTEYMDYHGNKVVLIADIFCSSFVYNEKYNGLDTIKNYDYFNNGRFSTTSIDKNIFKYNQKHKKISSIEKNNYFTVDFNKTFTSGEIFEIVQPTLESSKIKSTRKLIYIKNEHSFKYGRYTFNNNTGTDILLIEKKNKGSIFKNKSIEFHSPIWEIFPKNLKFGKGHYLTISLSNNSFTKDKLKKIGLFTINKKNNGIYYMGDGFSRNKNFVKSLSSFSTKYIFASDLYNPVITKIFRNKQKKLVVRFKDIGKGINWLSIDVQFKKDGTPIPGIPDPDRRQWVSMNKIPGKVGFIITVKDHADNLCVKSSVL